MHEQTLTNIGLSKEQAAVYETLIKTGITPASYIAKKTGLKRAYTYKLLEQLEKMSLVEKNEKSAKVTLFSPAHPNNLLKFTEEKIKSAEAMKTQLATALQSMISDYNLISGKPNVQFFEGIEGFIKVAEDSLWSATEVCQYIDIDTILKEVSDIDQEYAKKWKTRKTLKRMIYRESPTLEREVEALRSYNAAVRSIPSPKMWNTVIQIYDNKVSYVSFKEGKKIGIIIEDADIYEIQKMLFEQIWSAAKPLLNSADPTPPEVAG